MVGFDESDRLPRPIAFDRPGRRRKRDRIQPVRRWSIAPASSLRANTAHRAGPEPAEADDCVESTSKATQGCASSLQGTRSQHCLARRAIETADPGCRPNSTPPPGVVEGLLSNCHIKPAGATPNGNSIPTLVVSHLCSPPRSRRFLRGRAVPNGPTHGWTMDCFRVRPATQRASSTASWPPSVCHWCPQFCYPKNSNFEPGLVTCASGEGGLCQKYSGELVLRAMSGPPDMSLNVTQCY